MLHNKFQGPQQRQRYEQDPSMLPPLEPQSENWWESPQYQTSGPEKTLQHHNYPLVEQTPQDEEYLDEAPPQYEDVPPAYTPPRGGNTTDPGINEGQKPRNHHHKSPNSYRGEESSYQSSETGGRMREKHHYSSHKSSRRRGSSYQGSENGTMSEHEAHVPYDNIRDSESFASTIQPNFQTQKPPNYRRQEYPWGAPGHPRGAYQERSADSASVASSSEYGSGYDFSESEFTMGEPNLPSYRSDWYYSEPYQRGVKQAPEYYTASKSCWNVDKYGPYW